MANIGVGPPLAERADVHKSCKSIETLLNVLNDYCEAAGAVVALQKKLAKALRETAGLKVTGEIAGNAMSVTATIFETMSEIDTKFAKLADREYDGITGEVKKWFKKLAKEEKTHDDRINALNTRLKQAGQLYEKKAKKNARDAGEEHARYITLLTNLGPELSQEKYNHALQVTEKHITTTYNVASCLTRVADAEWHRVCESVRRFGPAIGPLGEWRSLCEGSWTGSVPLDLPDPDAPAFEPQMSMDRDVVYVRRPEEDRRSIADVSTRGREDRGNERLEEQEEREESRQESNADEGRGGYSKEEEEYEAGVSSPRNRDGKGAPPSSFPIEGSNAGFQRETNMDSIRSLSSFPSPPTHLPLPPLSTLQAQIQSDQPQQPEKQASETLRPETIGPSHVQFPSVERDESSQLSGSPDQRRTSREELSASPLPISAASSPVDEKKEIVDLTSKSNETKLNGGSEPSPAPKQKADREQGQPGNPPGSFPTLEASPPKVVPEKTPSLGSASASASGSGSIKGAGANFGTYGRGDYLPMEDQEFGIVRRPAPDYGQLRSRTYDIGNGKGKDVQRNDTGTSTGGVAALRNRYSYTAGGASPPPKDVPRLPLSVTDLATRYQPIEEPASPRPRVASPPINSRQPLHPALNNLSNSVGRPGGEGGYQEQHQPRSPPGAYRERPRASSSAAGTPTSPLLNNETARQRQQMQQQQMQDAAEIEIKQKVHELRAREREVELRSRELDRGRAQLMQVAKRNGSFVDDAPRSPRISQSQGQPPPSPRQGRAGGPYERPQSQYSYSTNHLIPPQGYNNQDRQGGQSQQRTPSGSSAYSRSQPASPQQPQDHADFCGCEACSVAKYKARSAAPSPHDLRPPEKPPNLRPEKPRGWIRRLSMPVSVGSAFSIDSRKSSGGGGMLSPASPKNMMFGMDGRKTSGEARRSYDVSGISNRSMTNLGRR